MTRVVEACCFSGCTRPVAEHLGREVFYPMCAEHAAAWADPKPGHRRCAAWLGCGNVEVPVADLSFRGFCPSCERAANGGQA